MKEDLHYSLGKSWKIPYVYAVLVGLPHFNLQLAWSSNCVWKETLCIAFEIMLLKVPICVAFTLYLCNESVRWCEDAETYESWTPNQQTRRDRMASLGIGICLAVVYIALSSGGLFAGVQHPESYVYWMALEFVTVLAMYLVLARLHWHRRLRNWRDRVDQAVPISGNDIMFMSP